MLQDVADAAAPLFSQASDLLGYDLWALVANGPEAQLNQTEFTQPALLTASLALYRLALEQGAPEPDVVAGHSLGEYAALVAAGVIEFADAVPLVQKRGQFMQTAVPVGEGGMAAVLGLSDAEVIDVCLAASDPGKGELVQAANFNAPGQVVIAGRQAALARAIEGCKQAGARRAMALPVSAPFHSELMKPAAEAMREALAEVPFHAPRIKLMQNVDAALHEDPEVIRANLVSQMSGAVLWTATVENMKAMGVEIMIECGPGRVLTGLARRIDKSIAGFNMDSGAGIGNILDSLAG